MQIPRRPDHHPLGRPRPRHAVLHVATVLAPAVGTASAGEAVQQGLVADSGVGGDDILARGLRVDSVPGHGRDRPGVWPLRVSAGSGVWRVYGVGCPWLGLGEERLIDGVGLDFGETRQLAVGS